MLVRCRILEEKYPFLYNAPQKCVLMLNTTWNGYRFKLFPKIPHNDAGCSPTMFNVSICSYRNQHCRKLKIDTLQDNINNECNAWKRVVLKFTGVKRTYDSLFETESVHYPERFSIPLEVIWYCTKLHLSDFQHYYKLKHSKIYTYMK